MPGPEAIDSHHRTASLGSQDAVQQPQPPEPDPDAPRVQPGAAVVPTTQGGERRPLDGLLAQQAELRRDAYESKAEDPPVVMLADFSPVPASSHWPLPDAMLRHAAGWFGLEEMVNGTRTNRQAHGLGFINQQHSLDLIRPRQIPQSVDRIRAAVEQLLRTPGISQLRSVSLPVWEPVWPSLSARECDERMGAFLRKCPHLQQLAACDIEARALAGCQDLRLLRLGYLQKSPVLGLTGISEVASLRTLELANSPGILDEQALIHVRDATQLQRLVFQPGMDVTDEHLRHLPAGLQSLCLNTMPRVRDAAFAHLLQLAHLDDLAVIANPSLTDEGVRQIAQLSGLRSLSLKGCRKLGDAGLAHLSKLRALERLDLSACAQFTGAALADLLDASREHLLHLDLAMCALSDEALIGLPRALRTLDLSFNSRLTDAGLEHLAGLQSLEQLKVAVCDSLTATGLARLKASLPGLQIVR